MSLRKSCFVDWLAVSFTSFPGMASKRVFPSSTTLIDEHNLKEEKEAELLGFSRPRKKRENPAIQISTEMLEGRSCLISRALPSSCEQESKWAYMTRHLLERTSTKRSLGISSGNQSEFAGRDEGRHSKSIKLIESSTSESDCSDSNNLIETIGRDNSINCILRCSRSDHGSLASLSHGFRSLIKSGELYRLRRMHGIAEQWVYFSCTVEEWVAYDPHRARWIDLPRMPHNECFMCSDKESLAVGTELLVFGKVVFSHIVLRYSILTNSWSPGIMMNSPRCLFGSACIGEKAIFAGGCDGHGSILSSAELYNSETRTWTTLPSMNKPRKMCSGVFMDGKFYVIGGMGSNTELLTCGEEFDLGKGTWRIIPSMSQGLNGASGAPPLVGVVGNELYAAHYARQEVRKYDKKNNTWVTLGRLPERPASVNGWGLAFRACGDQLIVIGGPRALGGGVIELHSWVPKAGVSPEWNMIARKQSGSFVYNCAVMSC